VRKGRIPLIEAIRSAYKPYLIAMKGWECKNAELREQVGLLSSDFSEKGRVLRSSPRSTQEGGLGVVESYMASWRGKLPDSDLSGRALELALTEIERSLR